MDFLDQVLDLAADLNDFFEGRIGEETILERHFTGPVDPRLREIRENLGQYLDDRERREEDEAWRKMQEAEMGKLIRLLRLSRVDQASKINFLYESETVY